MNRFAQVSAALLLLASSTLAAAQATTPANIPPAPNSAGTLSPSAPMMTPSMPMMAPNSVAPNTAPGAVTLRPGAARQEGFVNINGARIHYVVQGQGQPVLLIHGYPLSGELFSQNRDALAARYRVVTLDLRGFGQSSVSPTDPGSIQTYATDALSLMSALGIQKATIGGMSMGGPIVFEMYRRAPQRFSGLILIDTIANPASIVEQNLWKGMALKAQTYGPQSLVDELIKDMLAGPTRRSDQAKVNFLSGLVRQASVAGDVAGAMALANRPDSLPTLKTITVPTLIVVGLEDTVYPFNFSQKMQQGVAGSKLVIIPGAAHAAVYEKSAAANSAMLDFLNGLR